MKLFLLHISCSSVHSGGHKSFTTFWKHVCHVEGSSDILCMFMCSLCPSLVNIKVSQDPCDAHTTSSSSTLRFGTKEGFHPLLESWYWVALIATNPFYWGDSWNLLSNIISFHHVTIFMTTIILIYPPYWQKLVLNFCEMVNSQAISIKFAAKMQWESLNIIKWFHVTVVTKQWI